MAILHTIAYCVTEAWIELWRNRLVNLVSIATISVSLFILGTFGAISSNLNLMLAGWSNRVQLTIYFHDGFEEADKKAMEEFLVESTAVDTFVYVSKDDAIERFRSYFPDLEALPEMLETNPLPAAYEVQMSPNHRSPTDVRRFAALLGDKPGIEEVDYDLLWIERLTAVIDLVQALGFFIGGALIIASIFTIFNVIKLTVYGRQEEIGIMRLVGATHAYIGGPFLVEGLLQGGLGGVVALGLLYGAYEFLIRQTLTALRLPDVSDWVRFLTLEGCIAIICGGMAVGIVGSMLSVRRVLSGTG